MKIRYDDYKQALIAAGELYRMDKSYNWKKELFDKDFDKKLIADDTLTSDNIVSIFGIANSFLKSNLVLGMVNNNNFNSEVLSTIFKKIPLNGELIRLQVLQSVLNKKPEIIDDSNINPFWNNRYSPSITVKILENHNLLKILEKNIGFDNILGHLNSILDDEYVQKKLNGLKHLNPYFLALFDQYGKDVFLNKDVKELFLF